MSPPDTNLNRLFHEMANQSTSPEAAEHSSRRRQRAIGGMRALHRSFLDDQARAKQRRRYWTWGFAAAAVALCGTALAGAGGLLTRPDNAPVPAALNAQRKSMVEPVIASGRNPAPTAAPPPPVAMPVVPSEEGAPLPARRAAASVELEEVNGLFAEAKRARREHRDAAALALLESLLAKHPHSVLAHEASVERFRALNRLGRRSEARHYASAYLAQYPNGFAADEARRLVASNLP